MNYIQTLYIDSHKDPFTYSFGWAAPEYHLMGWALSCLQLNKIYGKTTLYANTRAAHLLIDTLQLPYTEVCLMHDTFTLIHPELWTLSKIFTYSLQDKPFLHFDGDVFLFNPLHVDLLDGELIAQNVEVQSERNIGAQKDIMRHFSFIPTCVKKDFESALPVFAYNAGILGGNNISFFHDYTALAFEYVYKNADKLRYCNLYFFNLLFYEQHLFYALARDRKIPVKVLIEEIIQDSDYRNLGDFHDVPFNRSYLHLLSTYKKDERTCIQMATKLKELYPEYYERIIVTFRKKNIRLSPCGFINEHRLPSTNTIQYNTHLQRLKHVTNHCPPDIEKEHFLSDFKSFYKRLVSFLSAKEPENIIFERDSSAQQWYYFLFSNPSTILNKVIVRCREIEIIQSAFDWAGLFNKSYRVGVDYYSGLQIKRGQYFNLIVAEATDNGFSLFDINELDHLLLQQLSEPLSINDILNKIQIYFEEEILQNNYQAYKDLIISSLKQLVLTKSIRPV